MPARLPAKKELIVLLRSLVAMHAARLVVYGVVILGECWLIARELRGGFGVYRWHWSVSMAIGPDTGLAFAGLTVAVVGTSLGSARGRRGVLSGRGTREPDQRERMRAADGRCFAVAVCVAVTIAGLLDAPGVIALATVALAVIITARVADDAVPTYRDYLASADGRNRRARLEDFLHHRRHRRGSGVANFAACCVLSSLLPVGLVVGFHATGHLRDDALLDVVQAFGVAALVSLGVLFFAAIVRICRLNRWTGLVRAVAMVAVGFAVTCVIGLGEIWAMPTASPLAKIFATASLVGLFAPVRKWRLWFAPDAAPTGGRHSQQPATCVDRLVEFYVQLKLATQDALQASMP